MTTDVSSSSSEMSSSSPTPIRKIKAPTVPAREGVLTRSAAAEQAASVRTAAAGGSGAAGVVRYFARSCLVVIISFWV